jgi:hypothetical protein
LFWLFWLLLYAQKKDGKKGESKNMAEESSREGGWGFQQ